MKLRTEMVEVREGDSSRHDALVAGHYDAAVPMWIDAANHDAAFAHALMQAMDGLWGLGPEAVASRNGGEIMREIMEDADSLMRSWGFDSGEVE